jgi:hypothetical protein
MPLVAHQHLRELYSPQIPNALTGSPVRFGDLLVDFSKHRITGRNAPIY